MSNSASYFVYHQSDEARKIIPYRPMMKLEDGDKQYDAITNSPFAATAPRSNFGLSPPPSERTSA